VKSRRGRKLYPRNSEIGNWLIIKRSSKAKN